MLLLVRVVLTSMGGRSWLDGGGVVDEPWMAKSVVLSDFFLPKSMDLVSESCL
jgi:hypothetical protein